MLESEFLCKVILIGDQAVGKTSILSRFVKNKFTDFYRETIGVDFLIKHVCFNDRKIKCQFWDASGAKKYRSIISAYYKGASGIVGVFDLTNRASFESLKSQLECFKNHALLETTIIIIGNKADLDDKREVTREEMDEYAASSGFISAEVSAKNNTNLNDSITSLVKQVYYKNEETIVKMTRQEKCLKTFSLPKIQTNTPVVEEDFSEAQDTSQLVSKSEFLNANSNSFLLANGSFYNKDQNSKIIADLVEQVSSLKLDVERKDELIAELNSISATEKSKNEDTKVLGIENCNVLSLEKETVESLRKELDFKKSKNESLLAQLEKSKETTAIHESVIGDLKNQNEELKNEISKNESSISDQRNKIIDLEALLEEHKVVGGNSELTITALQTNNNELTNQITQSESQIKEMKTTIEELEVFKLSFNDLKSKISETLNIDLSSSPEVGVLIKEKVQRMLNETEAEMKKKTDESISKKLLTIESESKVNHEVVERLVADLNRSETALLTLKQEHEALRVTTSSERETILKTKSSIEEKFESIKSKHLESQEEVKNLTSELSASKAKTIEQEQHILSVNNEILKFQNKSLIFKEEISKLLSDNQICVEPTEENIKESIRCLMTSSTDRGILISQLEYKMNQLMSQLDKEQKKNSETFETNKINESKITELEKSFKSLEANLSATIAVRDQLNTERSEFTEFFHTLTAALKLSNTFNKSNHNNVMKRITELLSMENDSNRIQSKLNSIDYDAKLKALEEELTNKEVHLNLLRNRIVDLEEGTIGKVYGKSELKTEYNDLLMETKKQKVKINKITGEYNALKAENTLLKAEAMDNISLTETNNSKDSHINELNNRISELTSLNDKQLIKINELKEQNDSLSLDYKQSTQSSGVAIQNLSNELRKLKQDLMKTETREKQLLEFRDIVSKKLGLNISGFTLGECEYVASIENVLNASQEHLIHVQQADSTSLLESSMCPVAAPRYPECPSWNAVLPKKKYCYKSNNNEDMFHYE